MKFLIVDDDSNSRRILQLLLKPYGSCICASNSAEAIASYVDTVSKGEKFDVVYLDLIMPDMDGLELLALIRAKETEQKIETQVPAFMLTGDAHISNINRAQNLGISEYLLKPINEKRLIQGLERLDLIEEIYDAPRGP